MSTWQEFTALTERAQIERVLAVMSEVVDEYGREYDYLAEYSTCVYVANGEPSCLVGHVAFRLGLPLETMAGDNPTAFESINGCAIDTRMDHRPDQPLRLPWARELTPGALHVLRAAQSVQDGAVDSDSTWGEALDTARRTAEMYNVTVH